MKTSLCYLLLGLAVLVAGCGKKSGGNQGAGGDTPGKSSDPKKAAITLADEATTEKIKEIVFAYCNRPEVRYRAPEVVRVAQPVNLSPGKQAVYVQFSYVNNNADAQYAEHDLFLLEGDKVLEHFRTRDEMRGRMGSVWLMDHPPPAWEAIPKRAD